MTAEGPLLPPADPPEPEGFPFWGFADVFLIAALALPCMFLGWGIVGLVMRLFHLHTSALGLEAVPEMSLGYTFLFGLLAMIFRLQYGRPFWRSLGWTRTRLPVAWCVLAGCGTTMLVGVLAWAIHAPPTTGPLMEMMKNHAALILLAIFGSTVAPLCEELAFRGFLQPLLVRSLGTILGIALTSLLFGGLHYSEYGDSWRSALLVAVAGAAFGTVRHWTGSTKAAAIMHASFNGLQFLALLAPGQYPVH